MGLFTKLTVALGLAIVWLGAAQQAQAAIYWANFQPAPNAIGSANNDGTNVDHQAVPQAEPSCDVAVGGNYAYYSYGTGTGYIGRADLNTGVANNEFLQTANDLPCGVDVNSTHIFFNNYADGAIGRANLDGSNIDHAFVTGGANPQHPFVTGDRLYWTNKGFGCSPGCSVGSSELDGDAINQSFIAPTDEDPSGVTANSTHVFWGNGGKIGRADLSGGNVNPSFIDTPTYVCDVAVDDTYIYWADYGNSGGDPGYIGRARLDGTQIEPQFIETMGDTCGLYVTGDDAGGGFTVTEVLRITCAGTCRVVTVRITFNAAGNVTAEEIVGDRAATAAKKKKSIKTLERAVVAGENNLKLKLTKTGKKLFKKKGKLKTKMRYTFTPEGGGDPVVQTQKLTIKKKRK
jgi:hypothetical protein